MSTGGIIGTVAGGALGAIIGGPTTSAILIGAGLGLGTGMLIDPIEPEIVEPEPMQLTAPTAQEGVAVPDILGTVQVSGNFIWYCCPRTEEVTEDVDVGGKGGGHHEEVVVGYKYYLSFAIGLCKGPVDAILCIYEDDKTLWDDGSVRPDDGHATISVPGRGEIDFYFGTDNQPSNSFMSKKLGHTSPFYRHVCYAVFRDFMIGSYNRVGSLKFVLQKFPEYTFNSSHRIGAYSYNPAHAIYHILVNGIGLPSSAIDEQSFSDAADTLAEEGLGVCVPMRMEKPPIRYIESICQHIRACLYTNAAGDIAIRLFRKDTAVEDMLVIGEEDLLEEIGVERQSLVETDNEVQVRTTLIKQ